MTAIVDDKKADVSDNVLFYKFNVNACEQERF